MATPEGNSHLNIAPRTLIFPPPLDRVITNKLKISNLNTEASGTSIAFKIKTTKPNRYSVKPHVGLLRPGQSIDVLIRYNFQKDRPKDLDERDKFQVESINLNEQVAEADVPNLFKTTPAEQIIKEKLKCRFADYPNRSSASAAGTTPSSSTAGSSEGSTSGESDDLRRRIATLEAEKRSIGTARDNLQQTLASEKAGRVMGISKRTWYFIIFVALLSFILGAVIV
eukprot:TRINITY_DN21793_c0_g1_i1.p1 TRINITY_DN21793_c0_g1~~TRINITY_DN21793_c0_g1_i1.p1  ORF type:complete len:226 (+),score=51.75 TRINITY_DN21793_c0_g1_i1:28-705(+)